LIDKKLGIAYYICLKESLSANGEQLTILIFANGDVEDVDWIRPLLDRATAVIAADGGTRHLLRLRHLPDVVIGDLDSLPPDAQQILEAEGVAVHRYPHDKDETDLELALIYAVTNLNGEIQIIGAFGGRLDQTIANMMLLAHPALAERHVELVTEFQRAWLIKDTAIIEGEAGDTISLVPLGGEVVVGKTSGLRWPLENERLTVGPARGLSNEMTDAEARIVVEQGTLLCIHTRQTWQR
jgi:thiamine pyrophosphokinase